VSLILALGPFYRSQVSFFSSRIIWYSPFDLRREVFLQVGGNYPENLSIIPRFSVFPSESFYMGNKSQWRLLGLQQIPSKLHSLLKMSSFTETKHPPNVLPSQRRVVKKRATVPKRPERGLRMVGVSRLRAEWWLIRLWRNFVVHKRRFLLPSFWGFLLFFPT